MAKREYQIVTLVYMKGMITINKLTKIDEELLSELRKIRNEKQFINGVFLYAEKQDERKQILDYIKSKPENLTSSNIVMMALEFEQKRK